MTTPSTPPVADDVSESGEFVLNRRGPDFAFPMEDAPKDGSILRLLVKFDRKSAAGAFEDTTEPSWTIGANNKASTGEDQWDIVGWSWEQDVFCHAYGATAIGWLPFHTESSEPAALSPPSPSPQHIGDAGGVEPVAYADRYVVDRLVPNEEVGTMYGKPQDQFSIPLYAALPPARVEALDAARAALSQMKEALNRQCDNMAFVVNHAALYSWTDKFIRELEEDRRALAQHPGKDAP